MIRFLRLTIPYYPVLIIIVFYINYTGDIFNEWGTLYNNGIVTLANFIHHITFTSFIRIRYANTIIGVEWTMAVEAFYYVIIGAIITSTHYNQVSVYKKAFLWILLFSLSFSFQYTTIAQYIFPRNVTPLLLHFMPFKYGYAFVLGGLAFYLRGLIKYEHNSALFNALSNAVMLLVPIMIFTNLFWHYFENVSVFYSLLTFIAIIFIRNAAPLTIILNAPPLQFLGTISYSLYLWHFFILNAKIVTVSYTHSPLLLFCTHFIISLGVAYIWFTVFEKNLYGACKRYYLRRRPEYQWDQTRLIRF